MVAELERTRAATAGGGGAPRRENARRNGRGAENVAANRKRLRIRRRSVRLARLAGGGEGDHPTPIGGRDRRRRRAREGGFAREGGGERPDANAIEADAAAARGYGRRRGLGSRARRPRRARKGRPRR